MAIESWMLEVNQAGMAKVADALELRIEGRIPCASCGGAVTFAFERWSCEACGMRGSPLVYAAMALGAGRADDASWGASWHNVRETLAARGLCRRPS